MISSIISDGNGGDNKLSIKREGEIGVVIHTHPPVKESRTGLPFREYFTLNGLGVSNDMIANGSVTPVEFCIVAEQNFDRFVKYISIKISDPGAKLDKFGALNALANGVEFAWKSQSLGELTIHDGLKDNLEFFRLTNATPLVVDLSGGGADAIIVTWDLAKIFGSQWGLKLTQGTTEKVVFRVRDNLTGLAEFNIIGHGTKV